jgi:hypothetical protein
MSGRLIPFRPVRSAPQPLGLYFRVGRNDQRDLLNLIAAGDAGCFGLVLDPTLVGSQREIRDRALARRLDVILDPRTQAAATIGGYTQSLGKLPWGLQRMHEARDYEGAAGRRLIGGIAQFALDHGFTQVLAPTHLLREENERWFETDIESTSTLRDELNRRGGAAIPVVYPLAISYAMLRNQSQREYLVEELKRAPIDSLWLQVDGFGSSSTGAAVRTFLDTATDFHVLGKPIVADRTGGLVGLSLLAFGGVGGLSHGVTIGESFDSAHWRRPRGKKSFGSAHRVYLPQIDMQLSRKEAEALFALGPKARAHFVCRDTNCCPRGMTDMIENSARHFLCQRMNEVAGLSQVPNVLKPAKFVEQHLRSTTDRLVSASTLPFRDPDFTKRVNLHRKRLDMMRVILGKLALNSTELSVARLPKTRAARVASIRPAP